MSAEPGTAAAPVRVVEAVCIVRELHDAGGIVGRTAIDKAPVDGPVHVRDLGLYGDVQADRTHHGGVDRAVYAYTSSELAHWSGILGLDLPPGIFGENLLLGGPPVDDAVIGEQWSVGAGGLVLEVTEPRAPCRVFAEWVERDGWVREFTERGRPGVYLRVERPGPVVAGDAVVVSSRPSHGLTMGQWFRGATPAQARDALASAAAGEFTLATKIGPRLEAAAARDAS